jgi:hypothetical protein
MLLELWGGLLGVEVAEGEGLQVNVLAVLVDSELSCPLQVGQLARLGNIPDRLDVAQVRLFYLVELGESAVAISV